MAKVLREITHPSFDNYKLGEVIEIEEKELTKRLEQFSKPFEQKKVTKKSK